MISLFAGFCMVNSLPVPSPQQETPNCDSLLSQSLPECQQKRQAQTYGRYGEIWGEISVEVASPVLLITEPKKRKEKRKNKNKKNKNKNQQV